MSLVFRDNPVKLYPDVDRRFTDSLTPSLHVSIEKNDTSKINSAVDHRRFTIHISVGSSGCVVECQTVNQGDSGSISPTAVSKLRQFRSPHITCVFWKRH